MGSRRAARVSDESQLRLASGSRLHPDALPRAVFPGGCGRVDPGLMAATEDGVPPVLRTDQIYGCLRALGMPEPEVMPRAAALGVLLMWAESSAAGADRLDQEALREGYMLSLHGALKLPADCQDTPDQPCPATAPWMSLLRSRVTRTLLDMDATRPAEDASGPVPAPPAHHLLLAAKIALDIEVDDGSEELTVVAARERLRAVATALETAHQQIETAREALRGIGMEP